MQEYKIQNLVRHGKRKTAHDLARFAVVALWQLVQATLFGCSPQFAYGWRRFLLRLFGAKIGKGVIVRPTARISFPWNVIIGDHSWVGDNAVLYSLAPIRIGHHAVVSQKCYLCAGSHDYHEVSFPQITAPIIVEDEAWVAADVFIALGVTIGRGAVIGARSTVLKDVPPQVVAAGHPLRVLGPRTTNKP